MVTEHLARDGYAVFDVDPKVTDWAAAALAVAKGIAADPHVRAANMRHKETWFVGVDALPNAPDGSIERVPLRGPWQAHISAPPAWHAAQLSIVYPGYPGQDTQESDANHRYRIKRHAAHVDGLLPIGPDRRRYLREPHAFILGLPLNHADAAPLMVWPGSQVIMGEAFRALIADHDPTQVDLTSGYQAARAEVFERITPQPVHMQPGQSVLLHRHMLHGVAPWAKGDTAPPEGRMVAYFRPQFGAQEWLASP
ncbi:MAG: hypothetical protein AB8B60_03560 [Sulfitobacter sp.]